MIFYNLCRELKSDGFPQTISNGDWFYIDYDKPPICLTDVCLLDRQGEYWRLMVPEDFETRAVVEDELPLSIQAMQYVTFKRLKTVYACKMPSFSDLVHELPKTLHEHWTKQLYSYEGPFDLRVEWDHHEQKFWAGYARWTGIVKGTEKTLEIGAFGSTPEEALAFLWQFINKKFPQWLKTRQAIGLPSPT